MQWFFRKNTAKNWGLALYQQGICLSDAQGHQQFFPCQGVAQWPQQLAALPLEPNDQVQLILPHSELHSLSLDKPKSESVGEDLFWALKDAVPLAPQDLQFDYYEPPAQPMGSDRVNVVCASKAQLKTLCQALPAKPVAIGNEDMVLRGLFPGTEEDRPALLLHLNRDGELLLAIYRQGMLYFSRWLQGYRLQQDELDPYLLSERLALDIQRALDYLESQLRQPPIDSIKLALSAVLDEALAPLLADSLALPVTSLNDGLPLGRDWVAYAAARELNETLA
ncbi:hypothetical protein PVT67_01825 [Gallaecimonas kandeliae]|uniref:hypothetical protein n=1 Tax=Gallaecimonas kandeliae TaxID=3029055 RepID=UPI002648A8E3|nr:hypothetical protein [Gallaecimonas kandeliae]WKE66012.1 hypothetical protein PVT67_01825 [Gallaecimonas kandeliae]